MEGPITRRSFAKRSVVAITAGMFANILSAKGGESGKKFEFLAVNDLHFTEPKLCGPWFEKAFAAMRASAPEAKFLIVGGDLTEDGTEEQLSGIKTLLPLLGIPVYVTPGNHDVAADGSRRVFEKHFPGSGNYVVEHDGWHIFSVNSTENRGYENTLVPGETLRWLDENLKKYDPEKPAIVSTHFPLGAGMIFRPKNADDLLERFQGFNVRHIFNGHWHGYGEMLFQKAPVTTDRCCSRFRNNHDGSVEKGWFLCEASEGKVNRKFITAPQELLVGSKPGY